MITYLRTFFIAREPDEKNHTTNARTPGRLIAFCAECSEELKANTEVDLARKMAEHSRDNTHGLMRISGS